MKTKFVIYQGKKIQVEYGYENYMEYIIVDGAKKVRTTTGTFVYTTEGIDRGPYIDCVDPVDKYGNLIEVNDSLYACVDKTVVRVKVKAIANKPYHLGCDVHARKITVTDIDTDRTYVLPEGERCIKATLY